MVGKGSATEPRSVNAPTDVICKATKHIYNATLHICNAPLHIYLATLHICNVPLYIYIVPLHICKMATDLGKTPKNTHNPAKHPSNPANLAGQARDGTDF